MAGLRLVLLGCPGSRAESGSWMDEVRACCARRGFVGLTLNETLEAVSKAPAVLAPILPALPPELAPNTPGWVLKAGEGDTLQRLRFLVKTPNPVAGDALTAEGFLLLRSVVFLLDGDAGGIDLLGPAMYASKMGVPLWVVSDRISASPWLLAYADAVVRPSAVTDLLRAALRGGG